MNKSFDEKNMAKAANTGNRVLTGRECQILDIWPKFEDGEPVMVGDKYEDNEGNECFASGVHLDIDGPSLVDSEGFHDLYRSGKRVKRPAPEDSWERLEVDVMKTECGYFGITESTTRKCLKCPKYDPDVSCDRAIRFDVLRRAKALAGVEVDK